jgi:hypothetical protein
MGGLEIALNVKKPIHFLSNLKLFLVNDRKGPNCSLTHLWWWVFKEAIKAML